MFEKEAENYRKDLKSKFFLSEPQLDLACQGFKDGYNKAKEEMQENGLALQSDMDKTIEQNIQLKKQIEKMKSDVELARDNANKTEDWETFSVLNSILDDWEIKEND